MCYRNLSNVLKYVDTRNLHCLVIVRFLQTVFYAFIIRLPRSTATILRAFASYFSTSISQIIIKLTRMMSDIVIYYVIHHRRKLYTVRRLYLRWCLHKARSMGTLCYNIYGIRAPIIIIISVTGCTIQKRRNCPKLHRYFILLNLLTKSWTVWQNIKQQPFPQTNKKKSQNKTKKCVDSLTEYDSYVRYHRSWSDTGII